MFCLCRLGNTWLENVKKYNELLLRAAQQWFKITQNCSKPYNFIFCMDLLFSNCSQLLTTQICATWREAGRGEKGLEPPKLWFIHIPPYAGIKEGFLLCRFGRCAPCTAPRPLGLSCWSRWRRSRSPPYTSVKTGLWLRQQTADLVRTVKKCPLRHRHFQHVSSKIFSSYFMITSRTGM